MSARSIEEISHSDMIFLVATLPLATKRALYSSRYIDALLLGKIQAELLFLNPTLFDDISDDSSSVSSLSDHWVTPPRTAPTHQKLASSNLGLRLLMDAFENNAEISPATWRQARRSYDEPRMGRTHPMQRSVAWLDTLRAAQSHTEESAYQGLPSFGRVSL